MLIAWSSSKRSSGFEATFELDVSKILLVFRDLGSM